MKMITQMKMAAAAILVTAPMALPTAVSAQEFPLVAGEYSNVSGIYIKDGGAFKYATHLAGQWTKVQEFAKSQGWISDYKILINENPRDGEPTLYLMTTFASIPDAAESERRNKAYDAFMKSSAEQQITESGNRAEYRTVKSSILLREYTVR
ncbi:hypothetical protein SAMN02745824_1479 [Parasphingorhabdus marina DSM 22363]|uniref:NIPSNAP protein n=1 Tax=Parasphingorhabdus marina DSM 22363 TaxID=1123272 RepID=A0A1N6D2V8_9SPHN|nr:hypothetical protein [Parasphingorhabdus marina]SIN65162.1 hypothetical protein SAMN02745824_1479 [Parasphingorhabdus marina DSM 22363]